MASAAESVEATKALLGQVVRDVVGGINTRLCAIGDELGLFKDLAQNGPATSEVLAQRLGLNERYIREWLYAVSAAGYLEFDKSTREASIPDAHIPVFVHEGGPFYQGGMFKLVNSALMPYTDLIEAFRHGGGIEYETYDGRFWDGLDQHSCSRYRTFLVSDWLPEMPDVAARLGNGATFADFGCGAGRSTIELAKAFPQSKFVGFDVFAPNIKAAQANATEAGVTGNLEFRQWDVSKGAPDKFDMVSTFDLIHDLPDPIGGLRTMREAVKDDGIYVLMDVLCEEDPADNEGPISVLKFGLSLHFCMTTALAKNGMGLGTVGLPESRVKEFCAEVGFSTVRRLPCEHPLNVLYEIRP